MGTVTNSSFAAPKVNSQAVARYLSPTILQNVVQNLFHRPGRGLNQTVELGENLFEIRVIRQLPLQQKSRRIGATTDGDWFSSQTAELPRSQEYGLRVNFTLDTPIIIPTHTQEFVPLNLLNAEMKQYTNRLMQYINATTIAVQLASSFNFNAQAVDDGGSANFVVYTSATDSFLDKLLEAGVQLDDGDVDNGIDAFPADGRIALLRSEARLDLLQSSKSVLEIGNWKAQDMVEFGVASPNAKRNTLNDGYFGTVDGTPLMMVSKSIWDLAEKHLVQSGAQMDAGTLDEVVGLVAHSMSTVRGIGMQNYVKIIDAQEGAGIKLQPAPRWGTEVFYELGIVPIVTDSFTNPAYPASTVTAITVEGENSI
jgi:hypothetical protein